MNHTILNFLKTEDGASTVDFTLLSAAAIGFALAVTTQVIGGVENLSGDISTVLEERDTGAAW